MPDPFLQLSIEFPGKLIPVLGQQVSVEAARRLAGKLVVAFGEPLPPEEAEPGLTHLFPTPEGRLGGREPLPTPGGFVVTPEPPTPPPTATPSATASVTATQQSGETTAVAVEPGAYEAARAATVTVAAEADGSTLVGSGWVYDGEGRVVMAAELVAGAERIEVVAADGRQLAATLLDLDASSGVGTDILPEPFYAS